MAAILLGAGTLLWAYRLDIATWAAIRLIDRSGFGPSSLTVTQVGFGGVEAKDIVAANGAVHIAAIAVEATPMGLWSRTIDRIVVEQPQAALVSKGGAVTLGGRALPSANGTSTASSPPWKLANIRIDQASFAFETGSGAIVAAFSTEFAYGGPVSSTSAFAVDLSVPVAGQMQAVHVEAQNLALLLQPDGSMRLIFDGLSVAPKDIPWTATRIGGEIAWQASGLTARIDTLELASTLSPAILVPIAMHATGTMAGPQIDFALHAEAAQAQGKPRAVLDLKGRHNTGSGIGSANLTSAPLVFTANGMQPRDLMPSLGTTSLVVTGSVGIDGSAKWSADGFVPALALHLWDIAYEPPGARLSKIRGDIRFSGGWPLSTASGQILRGTIEAGGLPSTEATLVFQVASKPELRVQGLQMDFAGGQLTASPFVVEPANPSLDTVISLANVDVAAFFELLGVDGLHGTGRLAGTLPLKLTNGKVFLSEGHVLSTAPGVLQLGRDALPGQLADAGQSVDLMLQALSDFHYDTLAADLVAQPDGRGTIALKLKGKNPALLEGRDFDINVSIQTNLDRLVQIALASMQAAQDLLRKTMGSARQ